MPNKPAAAATELLTKLGDVIDLDQLKALLSPAPLGDATVDSKPVSVDLKPNVSVVALKLALNLSGSLEIQALNGPEDKDADGIAGPKAKGEDETDPLLILTKEGKAWLKYRAVAGLKAKGSGSASAVGFEFDGGATAIVADYRAHKRTASVRDCLQTDAAAGMRFAFRQADVLGLGLDDSLALRLRGTLQAKVTLSVSDVFSTHLSDIQSATGVATAVSLSVKAGASITGSISLVDDFVVAFTRAGADRWTVDVRKSSVRGLGLGAKAGISVSFSSSGEIESLLNSYLIGIFGGPLEAIESILSKASMDELSAKEKKLVAGLVERTGLSQVPETITKLKEWVDALKKKADAAVKAAAKSKVEAGFAYEYKRITVETVIFRASLTRAAVITHHNDLAWGRLNDALTAPDVTVVNYLKEKSVKREQAWGFTLGLGKWSVSGKDTKSLTSIERSDLAGRLERSYLGVRGYSAKWVGRTWSWEVDFNASMDGFSADLKPKVSEFGFGLGLAWKQSGKLTEDSADGLMGTAELWRIVGPRDIDRTRDALMAFKGKQYEAIAQVVVGHGVFRAIHESLADSAEANAPDMAAALAAAMPNRKTRHGLLESRAAFTGLWRWYLEREEEPAPAVVRSKTNFLLTSEGLQELAQLESMNPESPYGFVGLVMLNQVRDDLLRFRRGMASLRDAIRNGEYDQDRIPKAFADMRRLWAQSHNVLAFGAFLVDAAARKGVAADVKRSMTISAGESDPVLIIAR